MKKERIAVAYSGGLDTSVIVKWFQETRNADVITVTGDLGQTKEIVGVKEKALATGALCAYVIDLKEVFATQFIFSALKAGALYEHTYPMATALGRPLLAQTLIEIALEENCTAIAHGCTGKGNDQVRFEVAAAALAPSIKVIAPLREWEFKSREEEIAYCHKHNIPVQATKSNPYSIDENMWGTSIECGILEDPTVPPPEDAYQRTVSPANAPLDPAIVKINFHEGIPVALNNKSVSSAELIMTLNEMGGKNGIGRIDLIENRVIGIKSREIYEAPAAVILHFAHIELERLTLDKETMRKKQKVSIDYADIIYNGTWFSPLRHALDAFINETQKVVNGASENSLYDTKLATYTNEDSFDHNASEGFIKIFSLPYKTFYSVNKRQLPK
ncbi:hypothetical protein CHS0354_023846 [Potamilus streckersoni]|uniref:Argininosuccinate synthase n=1 Tax=Potamilus streckersoni TaxID=2493646 RepID=A0AAE0RYY7_9BIVA|nr:hypothetical protein CHS0354_023846 [Potamilus streckersoni]